MIKLEKLFYIVLYVIVLNINIDFQVFNFYDFYF